MPPRRIDCHVGPLWRHDHVSEWRQIESQQCRKVNLFLDLQRGEVTKFRVIDEGWANLDCNLNQAAPSERLEVRSIVASRTL